MESTGFGMRAILMAGVSAMVLLLCVGLGHGAIADASPGLPAWDITEVGVPTVLAPQIGKRGKYMIIVENVGGAASTAGAKIKEVMPPGLTVIRAGGQPVTVEDEFPVCEGTGTGEASCTYTEPVVPSGFLIAEVEFEVTGTVTSTAAVASITGGAAIPATSEVDTKLGTGHQARMPGISHFTLAATDDQGNPVTQAGGHPHFVTTSVLVNNTYVDGIIEPTVPVEPTKQLVFYLPLGMLGNTTVVNSCPSSLVETGPGVSGCPESSRVGAVLPLILDRANANTGDPTHVHGIYSVPPENGYAAEFAFASNTYTFFIYASVVRHDGAYMLRVATPGVSPAARLIGLIATFYGDIQEHFVRGEEEITFDRGSFLTNPTNCEQSPQAGEASVAIDTWAEPGQLMTASAPTFPKITGCELLGFSSELTVTPETTRADEPSGYEAGFEFPQAPNDPAGLGTPPVKNVSMTLPEGTTISPSSANGLRACQETGAQGINIEGPESEEVAPDGLQRPVAGHCPLASQIATVEGTTPLLHEALKGHIFLAAPQCGGAEQHACSNEDAVDGKLFGLYLELEAPNAGVVIKLEGHASVEPGTGRITAVFDDAPQFPVSKLAVKLKTGPHAPIANPQSCGAARTSATVTPWSAPQTAASTPSSAFNVDWDGAGGACPGSMPFAPSFVAGTVNQAAATSSPFVLRLKREDREQNVRSVTTTLPEGLLANLSKVARCPEPQAGEAFLAACPASSQVGTVTVSVGPGSDPYEVTGKVFLTGPYKGAPFGLSVVVPAVAGPFNLGDVLVRVALFVDPSTLQVTAVSDALPAELDGVPLRIRTLEVLLDAQEFTLNPTSCAQMSISGQVSSTTGAVADVSSPFTTGGCKYLGFRPKVTGRTERVATKADGTGVALKVAFPVGHEANLAKFVMSFPTDLPVRHETLEKACLAATFEANPAACPGPAVVGHASVHTPLLAQPLAGPIYLVSHGSAKFPDAVLVLQGEGITLKLTGESSVSSKGVLTLTVPSAPDAPFSTFEAVLPKGPFSEFTSSRTSGRARGSQCAANLTLGVKMTAQNGAQVNETPKLAVPGCAPRRPSVKLLKAHATHHGLVMTVKSSMSGRVKISGHGLQTVLKRNLAAGKHTLAVAFTRAGRAAAHKHKKITVTVGLVAGHKEATAHKSITL